MEHLLINGTPSRTNTPLHEGDILTVHIVEEHSSYHVPPVKLPLSIVYEDEDILVANKPAKMPIHPSMDNYYNSLANALAWYYRDSGQFYLSLHKPLRPRYLRAYSNCQKYALLCRSF